jgi:tRNA threonylcarbamoyladenosine biosynthesis protein TsaB
MRILGIDTTSKFLSLGIYDRGKIAEYNVDLERRHSALLTVIIKRTLAGLGLDVRDIDYFACGIGPGSFTGIRVGVAAMKGFAFALRKPLIGIPTLDILAANAVLKPGQKTIVPAVDAKRSLIYCGSYRTKGLGFKKILPYMLLTVDEFIAQIPAGSLILGDALGLYKEKIVRDVKGAVILERDYWFPQGRNVIALALERIKAGKFDDPLKLNPIYLYPKECQIRTAGKK